jgi:glycosyltransferase involved in cell wall biosynthesis
VGPEKQQLSTLIFKKFGVNRGIELIFSIGQISMSSVLASEITPMVITYNEAPNLTRCLNRLTWAESILIVDSGSTDETLEIASKFPQVKILHRPFDDFANQCNFGLEHIDTRWVLSLDADYELSLELENELKLPLNSNYAAFEAAFVYRIFGRPLRGTLYPPRKVLYLKSCARYRNEGHGHRVIIDGAVGRLKHPIFHDDRKPLSRWLASQQRYAVLEARYLLATPKGELSRTDHLRSMGWPAPLIIFLYTLVLKRCLLDGWPGWLYILQRTLAEILIALEIVDRKLHGLGQRHGLQNGR